MTEEQHAIIFIIKKVLKSRTREALPSLKTCDKRIVQTETSKVNNMVQYITTSNITDCDNLLYDVELVVSEWLGKTRKRKGKKKLEKKEPYWKRRIKNKQDRSKIQKCDTAEQSLVKKRGKGWVGVMV